MDFDDLLNHNDTWIKTSAELVRECKAGLESGQLSKEQFDELMEDVLQIEKVDGLADDLERKIVVQEAINIFKSVISTIPL